MEGGNAIDPGWDLGMVKLSHQVWWPHVSGMNDMPRERTYKLQHSHPPPPQRISAIASTGWHVFHVSISSGNNKPDANQLFNISRGRKEMTEDWGRVVFCRRISSPDMFGISLYMFTHKTTRHLFSGHSTFEKMTRPPVSSLFLLNICEYVFPLLPVFYAVRINTVCPRYKVRPSRVQIRINTVCPRCNVGPSRVQTKLTPCALVTTYGHHEYKQN